MTDEELNKIEADAQKRYDLNHHPKIGRAFESQENLDTISILTLISELRETRKELEETIQLKRPIYKRNAVLAHLTHTEERLQSAEKALNFYLIGARYEWNSEDGLIGASLIQDSGTKARAHFKKWEKK